MFLRSVRSWLEAILFVAALGLGVAAIAADNETVADLLWFGAWAAGLLLIFSLALRLPLHLRGNLARFRAAGIVIAAVALTLVANIALYRHDAHFDVTATQRYTAPSELRKIAASLDRDVSVTYFYNDKDDGAWAAKQVLADLARERPRLHVRALDLDTELVAAREYGVRLYNTAAIEAEGRRTLVENTNDLRQIAYGIERVLKEHAQTVCFVTGHGERYQSGHVHYSHQESLGSAEQPGSSDVLEGPSDGIDRLKLALESIGFADRAVEPATLTAIPDDCAVLVDVGPRGAYAPDEAKVLKSYLSRGGRVLLMYDPSFAVDPELAALLGDIGVAVGDGVVVDPLNHYGTDQENVAVPYYPPHPITEQVALTVFAGARPIRLIGPVAGIATAELIATSQDGYVRALDPAVLARPGAGKGGSRGVVTLAAAVEGNWSEDERNPFRLIIIGNANFATNAYFPYGSNGDLAVAMIRWLAGDVATPLLRPAPYSLPEIRLTHQQMQVTFVLVEILLPLSVILFGTLVWWRRRR